MKYNIYLELNNKFLIKMFKLILFRRKNLLKWLPVKKRTKTYVYCEEHHIIPKSWFKYLKLPIDNSKNNLIFLTAAEHLLIHVYLKLYFKSINDNKMYKSMVYAIHKMCNGNNIFIYELVKNSTIKKLYLKIYNENKAEYSIIFARRIKNSIKGNIRIYNPNTGEGCVIKKTDIIPDGWKRGVFQSENCKLAYKNKSNTIKIYNPKTNECMHINKNDIIPVGFLRGLPDHINFKHNTNKKHMFNLKLKKTIMVDNNDIQSYIDSGWQIGSGYHIIFNLTTKKKSLIPVWETIPDGYCKFTERHKYE